MSQGIQYIKSWSCYGEFNNDELGTYNPRLSGRLSRGESPLVPDSLVPRSGLLASSQLDFEALGSTSACSGFDDGFGLSLKDEGR